MKQPAEPLRKVTVNLPAKWLEEEMLDSGLGITEILRNALKEQRHRRACRAVIEMRGKIKFSLTYKQIKEMRE